MTANVTREVGKSDPDWTYMTVSCVVGLQWGDEAKGKIVDLLGRDHDFVVRYNGGANAGHTVVRGGKTYKLSLLPIGILSEHMRAVIANGVVVHPVRFLEEVQNLRAGGIAIDGDNLVLSDHAHLIFPYHVEEESLGDEGSAKAIGTTGRGIGPCYQDKVGRHCSVRVGELLYPELLSAAGKSANNRAAQELCCFRRIQPAKADRRRQLIAEEYLSYARQMAPFIFRTRPGCCTRRKDWQASFGESGPGKPSTSIMAPIRSSLARTPRSRQEPGAAQGIPARNLSRIYGVIKAYSTRVGRGPFPTELDDGPTGIGERIRKVGKEYGTVTGRPRRCGWFDAVAVRHTAALADADSLAVMLLDVLSGLDELKICTAYELDGQRIDYFPGDAFLLEKSTGPRCTKSMLRAGKRT